MTTLLILEHDGQTLDASCLNLLDAAQKTGLPVHALVLGHGCTAVTESAARLPGVKQVLSVDAPLFAGAPSAVTLAAQVVALMPGYRLLIAAHNQRHRGALPRAAALLGASYLSDVLAIEGTNRFVRSIYAGSVLAHVSANEDVTLLTVRATSFAPRGLPPQDPCPVVSVAPVADDNRARLESREAPASDRPELGRARIVVAAGRGVGERTHMGLGEALADHLGAAVGASRAAVDAGFAPNAMQVGQTGKSVAPEVYLAFGISGAIQHLAGIQGADLIVAVNKDPDAPIFSVADIGWVGDLFEALPALTAGLPGQPQVA